MTKFNNYDLPGQLPVLSWNPIVMRCPGCELSKPDAKGWIPCWHLRMCNRMMHNPTISELHREVYAGRAEMRMHLKHADAPLDVCKPRVIATQFMGDFGQADEACRQDVFLSMRQADCHTYLVLTKWPENIIEDVPDNCWLGTTVTDQATADMRIPRLLKVKARRKWVSVEPMLGPVDLRRWLPELHFVACGPETGTGARACAHEWISDLAMRCLECGVSFYDKRDVEGYTFSRRREWPEEWKW